MRNLAFAALLLLTASAAAYFGFQYYQEKTAGELAGHQAMADEAETSHRLNETERQTQAALAASNQEALQARQEAAAAQAQLAEIHAALSASEAAARAAENEAAQAAQEEARAVAEEKKIAADALQLARRQSQEELAAASARLDTVLQLLELEKQRVAAAEKAAADSNQLAAQRQLQLDQTRQALAAALAKIPPAKP
jgi:hypothetical protein